MLFLCENVFFYFSRSFSRKIRMNGWGVLSIQYLVETDDVDGQAVFIEFLYLPADDDADDSM